jgi:mediator of RNA polymerase II transcription subunit 12, fungi type
MSLSKRNERLQDQNGGNEGGSARFETAFFAALDGIRHKVNVGSILSTCETFTNTANDSILMILRWASSIYRTGSHQIYLAVRLVRKYRSKNVNTDDVTLHFLIETARRRDCDNDKLSRLLAELVRSNTFSAGKYIQWLIATGALEKTADGDQAS